MIGTQSLVEREGELEALEETVAGSSGSGSVVLLSGEAGFGKTSLLRALVEKLDHRYLVLEAACEPVGIPEAFAPLSDLVDELPGDLVNDLKTRAGSQIIYPQMLRLLREHRVVLILEDVHWADEATLGLARYLGRRMDTTRSSLILTYRSEEVDLAHPLRLVIADLGRTAIRIDLPALTPAGVEQMAKSSEVDPRLVYEATLGNPFFVEELLRHPTLTLPPTVEEAVLARVSQLPTQIHETLYLVALAADGLPLETLDAHGTEADGWLDVALQRGLLVLNGGLLRCRHDLIRQSLLGAIPPVLERTLHRRLLTFYEKRDVPAPDVAKLAYHSLGSGEADKAGRYSLQAARDAARAGAHRQAAFHFSNALRFRGSMPAPLLDAALLEAASEHCLINAFDTASEFAGQRVDLAKTPLAEGRARAWHSYYRSRENDMEASRSEAQGAIGALTNEPASEESALALAVLSWVEMVEGNWEEAIVRGDDAEEVARKAGTPHIEVYAATTTGTTRSLMRDSSGRPQVEGAATMGVGLDLGEFAARALNNLGVIDISRGKLEQARACFDRMIQYCTAHELDAWYIAGVASRAWVNVASGRWDEADQDLEVVLGQRTCVQTEVETLVTAATLRCRRGDPGAEEMIREALARVEGSTDHDGLVMGCALALEGAWLGLLPLEQAHERYSALVGSGALEHDVAGRGALAYWALRLDFEPPGGALSGPPGLEWRGSVTEAAEAWGQKGFVVQAAVTEAMVPDADLEGLIRGLRDIGAEGVIRGLRRELQRRKVERLPRGERPETQRHPAGLTRRQAEVLTLVAAGLSNAAIADKLFISEKTASHHVSAVLTKLNVSSRLQAAAHAVANGWVSPSALTPK